MAEELVLLDTNFLMVPHQFGVDIFEELDRLLLGDYKPIVLSTQEAELGSIAKKAGGKDKTIFELFGRASDKRRELEKRRQEKERELRIKLRDLRREETIRVERVEAGIKLLNVLLVPALVALAGVAVLGMRRIVENCG